MTTTTTTTTATTATATTQQRSGSSPSKRQKPTIFRKVFRYLQDQAAEQSTSRIYLTPPGKEPHQHQRLRIAQTSKPGHASRNFSATPTAVDQHFSFHRSATDAYNCQQSQRQHQTPSNMNSRVSSISQHIKRVQYATENLLQSYEVFIPQTSSTELHVDKYWVLYIHGGYFRDPKVDATAFRPALEILSEISPAIAEESETHSTSNSNLTPPPHNDDDFFAIQHNIAGYASINYRLAPHPSYPQDSKTTPKYELRTAKWPNQIEDILAAIRHLQSKYNFGSKYIISGHSVGAELAYLATLKAKAAGLPAPKAVIGCNGIYDFPAIHLTNPAYEQMTSNAMDAKYYDEASPARHKADEYLQLKEQGTTSFLLSHARDDGLVVWEQVEIMKTVLERVAEQGGFQVKLIETKGSHDVTWQEGKELAKVIKEGINMALS